MNRSSKIWDIEKGKIMIVSDLQGNYRDFKRILEKYLELKNNKEVDYLIFDGDLIHSDPGTKDESKKIIDELIALETNKNNLNIIAILGNHELPHIYQFCLMKGSHEYTMGFEKEIIKSREKYINFFKGMPFAVRTSGGVLINHTGANSIIGELKQEIFGINFEKFKNWDHNRFLEKGVVIAKKKNLIFSSKKFTPEIGDILFNEPFGDFLFEVFMNKNEKEYGGNYHNMVNNFLDFMSSDLKKILNILITGHIRVPEGVEIVSKNQIRISTSCGARTDHDKTFLLIDSEKHYQDTNQVLSECMKLY